MASRGGKYGSDRGFRAHAGHVVPEAARHLVTLPVKSGQDRKSDHISKNVYSGRPMFYGEPRSE